MPPTSAPSASSPAPITRATSSAPGRGGGLSGGGRRLGSRRTKRVSFARLLPSRSAGRHSGPHAAVLRHHARAWREPRDGGPAGKRHGVVRRARHARGVSRRFASLAPSRRGLRLAAKRREPASRGGFGFRGLLLLQALDVVSQLLQPPAAPSGVPAGDAVERRGRRHRAVELAAGGGALLAQRQARDDDASAPSSALSGTAAIAAPGAFLPPIPAGSLDPGSSIAGPARFGPTTRLTWLCCRTGVAKNAIASMDMFTRLFSAPARGSRCLGASPSWPRGRTGFAWTRFPALTVMSAMSSENLADSRAPA